MPFGNRQDDVQRPDGVDVPDLALAAPRLRDGRDPGQMRDRVRAGGLDLAEERGLVANIGG